MRRLHPISEHEQTVAQGAYAYRQAGEHAGAGEEWELTRLPDGGHIYRVEAGDGEGLWHLMLAPDGRPDRLQLRLHDDAGRRFDATYTFFDTEVLVSGGQVGRRPEKDVTELPAGYSLLWLPFAGRGMARIGCDSEAGAAQAVPVYLMRQESPEDGWLSARPVDCAVERVRRGVLEVPAGSFEAEEIGFKIAELADQHGWFDEHGITLWWQSDDQVQAVLSRYRWFAEPAG